MSCGKLVTNELELRVPHGKLAAKTWFEETEGCKRILALHGWQDNSATFDRLIPGLKHEKGLFVFALTWLATANRRNFRPACPTAT